MGRLVCPCPWPNHRRVPPTRVARTDLFCAWLSIRQTPAHRFRPRESTREPRSTCGPSTAAGQRCARRPLWPPPRCDKPPGSPGGFALGEQAAQVVGPDEVGPGCGKSGGPSTAAVVETVVYQANETMVTIQDMLFIIGALLMGQLLTWPLRLLD